jgi:hypothetical protein
VNNGVLADVEADSPREAAPGTPDREANNRAVIIESWLHDHLDGVALAVVAAGLVPRLWVASRSYLNPDEALHYDLINQPSVFLAYKASLSNAHPPLLFLLLYFWHFLGHSELMLRLPSVLVGTAFCWFTFKWIGIVFGRAASLIGVIVAAFSPPLIALSAQLREYALLLFCVGGALYFLELAFREESVSSMWYFSVFLYLAILSHYSAAFIALALGVYSLARIARSHFPRKLILAWSSGQAVALAIYGFLYVTHVSKVNKDDLALWAKPIEQYYFHREHGNLLMFTRDQTSAIFRFLFEQTYISEAMFVFFVVGVAFLLVRDWVPRWATPRPLCSGILLVLPFIAVWGASIAGIYPYVGSRHTVFLAPFAIAAASFVLAAVYGQKLWAGLLIAALLMGTSNTSAETFEPYITKEDQSRALMMGAMDYLHQSVPRSNLILVDMQSSFLIAYYLCGAKETMRHEAAGEAFNSFGCDGYSIVSTNYHVWKLTPDNFPSQFENMVHTYGRKPGDRIWIFQNGWGANLDRNLAWSLPKFRCLAPKSFGRNLTVIPFVVSPDFSPATPAADCPPPAFNSFVN